MGFGHFDKPASDSGRIYESRFLGAAEVDDEFLNALEKLPRGERRRFQNDDDVYQLFKEHYKGDPTDPKGIHARELRGALIDALGLGEEDFDKLKFYTALGVPAIDHMMGVDGFFEYTDPKTGQLRRVTIDVTMRDVKEDPKADVVIGELPDASQDSDNYVRAIDDYATKIAHVLVPPPPKKGARRRIMV